MSEKDPNATEEKKTATSNEEDGEIKEKPEKAMDFENDYNTPDTEEEKKQFMEFFGKFYEEENDQDGELHNFFKELEGQIYEIKKKDSVHSPNDDKAEDVVVE